MPCLTTRVSCLLLLLLVARGQELVQNGGYESLTDHWECWSPLQCTVSSNKHSGLYAMQVENRWDSWQGPSQYINVTQGRSYHVSGYIKLLNDKGADQTVRLEIDFEYLNDTHRYVTPAGHSGARASDGWIYLAGTFTVPKQQPMRTLLYFKGPDAQIDFLVDDVSVVPAVQTASENENASARIDRLRKSDIHIHITAPNNISRNSIKIRIVQKSKSFPFGTAVAALYYNDPSMVAYRDFVHQHFNWAVPESALSWLVVEPQRGQRKYQAAIDMIKGLRSHGVQVRGHSLVWSVEEFVQEWVKRLHGEELRQAVQDHIADIMNRTRGLLEHWDVNKENLHGQWFQNQLRDPDYNLELFRIARAADPDVKLFLNDYDVVASGALTNDYLQQAVQFKTANVGLYGVGVQCQFGDEEEPSPVVIKDRLDTLAEADLPIWVTELEVQAQDENKRAEFYEKALTAIYSHPAVEGILLSGFWDEAHPRGEKAALVSGDNLKLTAAGKRVLDLYEKRWMTDETHVMSEAGDQFTVRGFHGDYDIYVYYQNRELDDLRQTFSLSSSPMYVSVKVLS